MFSGSKIFNSKQVLNLISMKVFNKLRFSVIALFMGALLVVSCNNKDEVTSSSTKSLKDYDYKVVHDWNETFLDVERYAAGYRPGPAPRALAYIGLATYEACISAMPEFNSLASFQVGLNVPSVEPNAEYHWPTVINAVYGYLMPKFFSSVPTAQQQRIATTKSIYESKGKSEASAEVFERSQKYGEAVASAIWEYSKTDKVGHDHYLDPFQSYDWQANYKKEGDWRPTFPGPGKPMGGVWGGARTFAINQQERLCRTPLKYSTSSISELYSQALEVYSQNTPTLSYENEWIGEYWSDDLLNLTFSPGPRWLAIGDQVLVLEKSNLETAVFMTVKVGLALNDSSVGAWYSKFYYNVERPQTYINRVIDPKWKPALYNPLTGDEGVTPSFPAYPSGHSTMGAAGAEALASIFGYDYAMTDYCHKDRTEFEGTPRTFSSFLEMAEENAWSRVPLGVHFRMDCTEGVRFGLAIGRKVNNLPWKK
jgi:hypothetical protein